MRYPIEDQNEYAKNSKGEIKFILEVERGTKGFSCLGCQESMHPVRRTVEHYRSYFRHEAKDVSIERKCTFSSEKARRILAMDILGRTKRIKVPNLYKYSPDGQSKVLIKEADYIEATSVKGDITFYNDEAGLLKWGKSPNIEESAVLLQPDITFFDILQNPILLIQFVEKYKITEEKRLKIRELGIDVVQIIIPRDSPENIAKSLEITQHTKWMYNHIEQNTDYAQLQHRNREGISAADAIEMGFFRETLACRESQISNLVRKIKRYLESEHYRLVEEQLRAELFRIEQDTERDRTELERLRSKHGENVEKRLAGEIAEIAEGEKTFNISFGATEGEVRKAEEALGVRYSDETKRIGERRREVENLIREYDDVKRAAFHLNLEQKAVDDQIRTADQRISRILEDRESIPGTFEQLEAAEQSRAQGERKRIEEEEGFLPSTTEDRRRELAAGFESDRERTIKRIKDRDCSGDSELSTGIKRILNHGGLLSDWNERQAAYKRNRTAYDCLINRTYKKWFES